MQTAADKPELEKRIEHDPDRPLTRQQLRAVDLLVAGELTTQAVADELGMSRHHLWRWRSLPAFQAEYRKRLAMVEQEAMDHAIARRVNRVAALNDTWLALREEIAAKGPRPDLVYALIAASTAAAKELGQWQEKVDLRGQLEVAQPVRVIRFVEQEPRREARVVEAEYTPAQPNSGEGQDELDPNFTYAVSRLAWAVPPIGGWTAEQRAGIRTAIARARRDPGTVLTAAQYLEIYRDDERSEE